MSLTAADRQRVAYVLGVMDQPGLATGYPELVRLLNRLFSDKVAKLPWVPRSWLPAVAELQAKNPGDLIKLAPALNVLGFRQEGCPSFADTDDKAAVWATIYKAQQDAIGAYAAKQAEEGAAELRALEADAAFWDGAYKLAVTVRDLPSTVVKATAGGVADFAASFLPDSLKKYGKIVFWLLVVLVVGGLVLWYRRKVGGIVSGLRKGMKA